jgi:hypothetical protein
MRESQGTILVEIIDNGCGISDLDSIVQFFSFSSSSSQRPSPDESSSIGTRSGSSSSSCDNGDDDDDDSNKSSSGSSSSSNLTKVKGQYGVGLTTCLLYSQLHTHQPLR